MSNLFRNLAARGGLSFAHLSRGARSEDRPGNDDDSGKGKKGKRADDDGPDEQQDRDNGDSKKGKRAEGGDQDDDDDDGDDDGDDLDDDDGPDDDSGKGRRGKKGKRAAAEDDDSGKGKKGKRADDDDDADAEEDDDDEEEMRGKSAAARARRRERARCAAIFACKGAGRDPELAAELAFETTMTRKEAIAVLSKTRGGTTGQRIRGNPQLGTGAPPSMTSEQAVAASWDAAFQKAGARPRRGR